MSGDTQFLTNTDGSIPANIEAIPATSLGQFAKNAVDSSTRALLVKAPAGDAIVSRGEGYRSSVSSTRPSNTTAYTAGDAVGSADTVTPANAGTAIIEFTNIGPSGGNVVLTDVSLRVNVASVPSGMGSFRLHLYNAAPDAILDNAAWDLSSAGDRSKYLGYLDLSTPVDLGSTLFSQNGGFGGKVVKLATGSTSLWGVLQTISAFTPSSGTVKVIELNAISA